MAPHSSILAWRIPWTEEPGGLQSLGSHRLLFSVSLVAQFSHSAVSDSWQPHGLSIWIPVPEAGIELWPPALNGEFLTIGPSAKSLKIFICTFHYLGLREFFFFLPTCKSLNFSFHNGQFFSEVTFLCCTLCKVANDYKACARTFSLSASASGRSLVSVNNILLGYRHTYLLAFHLWSFSWRDGRSE